MMAGDFSVKEEIIITRPKMCRLRLQGSECRDLGQTTVSGFQNRVPLKGTLGFYSRVLLWEIFAASWRAGPAGLSEISFRRYATRPTPSQKPPDNGDKLLLVASPLVGM